ncbi:MAG: hypothetical protein ACRDV9_02015 [Acidimicrobiia bacterium]
MTERQASPEAPASSPDERGDQAVQQELVQRARSMSGVAEVLDVYGKLTAYTNVLVNVQPSQVRNATGGNAG